MDGKGDGYGGGAGEQAGQKRRKLAGAPLREGGTGKRHDSHFAVSSGHASERNTEPLQTPGVGVSRNTPCGLRRNDFVTKRWLASGHV